MQNIFKESINSGQGFKATFIQIWALIVGEKNQNSNFTQLPTFFARGSNLSLFLFVCVLERTTLFYFFLNLNAKYV